MLELKTTDGYVLILKRDYLTYGEKKEVKKILQKTFSVNPIAAKQLEQPDRALEDAMVSLDLSHDDEAKEKVFELLIERIITPDGQEITANFLSWLNLQNESVAEGILTTFNQRTKDRTLSTQVEEKKSNPTG